MAGPVTVKASAVEIGGRGVLILGRSGSGKSSLALELIARGASLVADDAVILDPAPGGGLEMRAPAPIAGMIEARFVGLLGAPVAAGTVPLALAVDMDRAETERLPPRRSTILAGCEVPLVHKVEMPHFPAAIAVYLRHGRQG